MDISTITRLYAIFTEKKWTNKLGNNFVFENFCTLLSNLNNHQSQLILDLVGRYTWITLSEYQNALIRITDTVETSKLDSWKRIILFPVMKLEDEQRTKSGHTILYMLKAMQPMLPKYKKIDFDAVESFAEITSHDFKLKDTDSIFLLDDYLGSGETIIATVNEILKNPNISSKHLNVISIAAQSDSDTFLKAQGIAHYTDMVTKKGITDYYISPELEEKIKLMEEIEKMIPGNHFSFGYNQSEGLITLMRTPDNTFPIFWKDYKHGGVKFEAPFSRL